MAMATAAVTCAQLRHCSGGHFTCAHFVDGAGAALIVAGDIDGVVHVFSLRSMRQVASLHALSGAAAVRGADNSFQPPAVPSTTSTTSRTQQRGPQGVLAVGTLRLAGGRRVLWVHGRAMHVTIFDFDALERAVNGSDNDDDDDEIARRTDARHAPICTIGPLRNFSFAPAVCFAVGAPPTAAPPAAGSGGGGMLVCVCPHEQDVVMRAGTTESTVVASLVFHVVDLAASAARRAAMAEAAHYDGQAPLFADDASSPSSSAVGFGQIMSVALCHAGGTGGGGSGGGGAADVVVGFEGGQVCVVRFDVGVALDGSPRVRHSVLARCRAATDPAMSLCPLHGSSSALRILCGAAEGASSCLALSAAGDGTCSQATLAAVWSGKLSAGVGHIVQVSPGVAAAFLWNGDAVLLDFASTGNDDATGGDGATTCRVQPLTVPTADGGMATAVECCADEHVVRMLAQLAPTPADRQHTSAGRGLHRAVLAIATKSGSLAFALL